jgi:peroxiredoxin
MRRINWSIGEVKSLSDFRDDLFGAKLGTWLNDW